MIKVPANVIGLRERIALSNELEDEVIISAMENKLPDVFTATVVSSMGETNNPSLGTAYGNAPTNNPNEQSYFFARMRRVDIDEMEKPDPFLAKTRRRARKLANMHPLGVLLKAGEGKAPQIGEEWTCRYLTKDRKGIVLLQKVGVSQNFLALATKESPFQMQASAFGSGIVGDYVGAPVGVWSGNLPALGPGWKPGGTMVPCFGIPVPCSELVNFGRTTPVDYSAYGKNPAPSQATDDLFWSKVIQKIGAIPTANKIRFFNAWAARESSQSTNNPFATMWPGASRTWSTDPNMTTYNYHKPSNKYPNGYSWVKNYSTMEAGAIATSKTILSSRSNHYKGILAKLRESNPEFPDSWFNSPQIQKEFCTWGGCSPGGDGHGYYKVVRDYYKSGKRRSRNGRHWPINTNRPGGRCGKCIQT